MIKIQECSAAQMRTERLCNLDASMLATFVSKYKWIRMTYVFIFVINAATLVSFFVGLYLFSSCLTQRWLIGCLFWRDPGLLSVPNTRTHVGAEQPQKRQLMLKCFFNPTCRTGWRYEWNIVMSTSQIKTSVTQRTRLMPTTNTNCFISLTGSPLCSSLDEYLGWVDQQLRVHMYWDFIASVLH